jgi:ketosteroid isomerase-like protein
MIQMKIVLAALVFTAGGMNLPQALPTSATSPEAAVRQADEAWAKTIASKSVDQTIALYDPEAVTAGSAMFPARGIAALRTTWAELFAQPGFVLTWKTDEVVVTESGTIAYSSGSWRMASPSATGPYLAVWRKQPNGQWKVLIDAAWYARPAE